MTTPDSLIDSLDPARPVLIAGPTASGKSALALAIAAAQGGAIINADALQVYGDWRVLTARPSDADCARAPHHLYGHVPGDVAFSVGDWLRAVAPLLSAGPRPIVVGGTGLYFRALTEGLAQIPDVAPDLRARAEARVAAGDLAGLVAELDAESRAAIDTANPRRVVRAWEVLQGTGRGIRAWQRDTPAPLLPLSDAQALQVTAPVDWLNARIAARMCAMLKGGALEEARANRPGWRPDRPSAKAIGAAALMAYLDGQLSLPEAEERAIVETRQFAKRQRTWFRARMGGWTALDARALA